MKLFKYDEWKYYSFGLSVGIANFMNNGVKLGLRKTIGKVAQPINSYTRFPEYFCMEECMMKYVFTGFHNRQIKILDVGSPKLFGLYLAFKYNTEIHLTDLSLSNIEEYELLWDSIKDGAKGNVIFSVKDARWLDYADNEFDIVYSMSVIEHIEGMNGDIQSMEEMIRVVKCSGLLLVSVPFGKEYIEQFRIGLDHKCRYMRDDVPRFFQRIYNKTAVQERVLMSNRIRLLEIATVWRRINVISKCYGKLRENIRGCLGFTFPLLSCVLNKRNEGIYDAFESIYGGESSNRDLYGDLIIVGVKGKKNAK